MAAVEQLHVLEGAVREGEVDDGVLLDAARLLHDALCLVGYDLAEEALPVLVGEGEAVEELDLAAQVGDELGLAGGGDALVALVHELLDELLFQLGLGLIGGCGPCDLGHLRAHGRGGSLEDEAVGRGGGAFREFEVVRQHAASFLDGCREGG